MPQLTRTAQKEKLVKALAQFLAGPFSAHASISLEVASKAGERSKLLYAWTEHWVAIRNATPVSGWASVEEAEAALREFLG